MEATTVQIPKKEKEVRLEMPFHAKEQAEERNKFFEKRKNISRVLNSKQLHMRNTETGQSEILYNVKYTECKRSFIIQGRRWFGEPIKINIGYGEFEYDRNNQSIMTYNSNKFGGWFKWIRSIFKKTPYMLHNCTGVVEVESLYGKDSSVPLKIKNISESHYSAPSFREGIILQFEYPFVLYEGSNSENYVSDILLISYLTSDVYVLHLINHNGVVKYSHIIRASEEGILSINDGDTHSLKIVSLSE